VIRPRSARGGFLRAPPAARPAARARHAASVLPVLFAVCAALGAPLLTGGGGEPLLAAQEPPDTLPPDTVAPPGEPPDTVGSSDSVVVRNLPDLETGAPAKGMTTGVWTWNREDLLSTSALTLAELLDRVPGVLPLKGGDYGTPTAVTAFGVGGGRVRVYWDGFEILPMDGGVVDLSRVGLGGLDQIRMERGLGELRIELKSQEPHDPRARSTVEAGTGDLDTNNFRGTFIDPDGLGGTLGLFLERIDTRGPRGDEAGNRTGGGARYFRHFGERAALGVELRNSASETSLTDLFPGDVTRTDWLIRGRARLADSVVAQAFWGRSTIDGEPVSGRAPIEGTRSQFGGGVKLRTQGFWLDGVARFFGDPELPSSTIELDVGFSAPRMGGIAAGWNRDAWPSEGASRLELSGWTRPLYGVSLFASYEDGARGTRVFPLDAPDSPEDPEDPENPAQQQEEPATPPPPTHRITERTGLRVGANLSLGPVELTAAWLRVEADSLLPFGLHTDRAGVAVEGGEWTGVELSTRIGLTFLPGEGFYFYGSAQEWDGEARYLPERSYRAGLGFQQRFLESENFELWANAGVRERSSMLVPLVDPEGVPGMGDGPGLQRVPFYQSWDGFFQLRIVSVRIWARFENFTAREGLQDFPGRVQPFTRATFGVRWTFWN